MQPLDPQLPLSDPGTGPSVIPTHRPMPVAVAFGVVCALMAIGAICGMYIQGPAVRMFFGVTGLKPGGGALRDPIAVAPPPVVASSEQKSDVIGHYKLLQKLG
jgi:HlyD family secretion protein